MKKILFVLLICFPLFLFGQYRERVDTVKVIMIVCDTATRTDIQFKQDVRWMFGYAVYEMRYGMVNCLSSGITQTDQICYDWYKDKLVEYLDSEKKQIKKSIIVWQTKEL